MKFWRRKPKPVFAERSYYCACGQDVTGQLRRKFNSAPTTYALMAVCRFGHYTEHECAS